MMQRGKSRSHCFLQAGNNRSGLCQLMAPNADHAPAGFAQRLGYFAVALNIARNFGAPICSIGLGGLETERAGMPKTAVNKHHYLRQAKSEIWLSNQCLVAAPA